jgi:glycosyltransferase involved in cell wall biosynthesis
MNRSNLQFRISPVDLSKTEPGVYALAAYLGRRFGCNQIIDVGCGDVRKAKNLHSLYSITAIGSPDEIARYATLGNFSSWIGCDFERADKIRLPDDRLSNSVIICAGLFDRLANPAPLLENLKEWLNRSPICILSVCEGRDGAIPFWSWTPEELERMLRSEGFNVVFSGYTGDGDHGKEIIAVIEKGAPEQGFRRSVFSPAPGDFRVVALMSVYNEEDILARSLSHLFSQGIEVYLIDNWSTDATYEVAEEFLGRGLIGLERFPKTRPPSYFTLRGLLAREEQVSREIEADWYIHHDADEIRSSPWQGVNLREALYRVDREGFNCIDHTIIEFYPVDNGFVPGTDFESYFRHFEFGQHRSDFVRVNAWKNLGKQVGLAKEGGHHVCFEGAKVYPYKFLIKHYRVRSQQHGERKIFSERKARWNPGERAVGMHDHYDHIEKGHVFLRQRSELQVYDEARFAKEYLVERLTGIGATRGSRKLAAAPAGQGIYCSTTITLP